MAKLGIKPIDVVVVNLYPFDEAIKSGKGHASNIENIDIGGPCMLRASAKSHQGVAVLSDPSAPQCAWARFVPGCPARSGSPTDLGSWFAPPGELVPRILARGVPSCLR